MLDLAGKVLSGVVSMTMLLFSSYEGNNARFSDILIGHDTNTIRIRTSLDSAFENDFEQIFRSGSPVVISYNLEVKRDNSVINRETYYNTVIYDPLNRYFLVDAEAANYNTSVNSFEELKTIISEVDIFFDYWGITGDLSFELSAHLNKVTLESLEREFDLMILWNYKTPAANFKHTVDYYES